MEKIGILTFHKSINYGSVLQTYALQKTLLNLGYKVEIIDYEPQKYEEIYGTFKRTKSFDDLKYNLKRVPIAKNIRKQKMKFDSFRNSSLFLSADKYNVESEFTEMVDGYGHIICGSDQIWNIHALDCDPVYFLPVKFQGNKIAYAVSVNNTKFNELQCDDNLRAYIVDFDHLSCREESGAEKIYNFIEKVKRVDEVLDPTLLCKKEDYDEICSERLIVEKYIFLYNVWSGKDAIVAAKIVSRQLDLPVYTIMMRRDEKYILKIEKEGMHVERKKTSPENFVSLIRYADFIITDSFHGTAFALIFEKKFVCVNEKFPDGRLKNDERILNILNKLELMERYLTIEQMRKMNYNTKFDYTMITSKRMQLAKKSKEWLINAIEKNDKKECPE